MPGFEAIPSVASEESKKKDTVTTINADDIESLAASVDEEFGADVNEVHGGWDKESKVVTAVAEDKLFADAEIQNYIQDPDYKKIVDNVIVDVTTNGENIRTFQEGLRAATDKATYVEQATEKLVANMKEESEKRITQHAAQQEGQA